MASTPSGEVLRRALHGDPQAWCELRDCWQQVVRNRLLAAKILPALATTLTTQAFSALEQCAHAGRLRQLTKDRVTEMAWILLACDGDARGWMHLEKSWRPKLERRLVRKGLSLPRASELSVDIWGSFYEEFKTKKEKVPATSFSGYYRMAAEYSIKEDNKKRRRDMRRYAELADKTIDETAAHQTDVETRLMVRQILERISSAVENFSAQKRTIFSHMVKGQASHQWIANQVGLSEQRVRQTICEIRRDLRRLVGRKKGV